MKLNYKASTIAKVERESGLKLFTVLNEFVNDGKMSVGVSDLLFLWQAGGGTDEEFDSLIKESEDGLADIILAVIEGINEAGFLGKKTKLDMEQVRKELKS